jgi:hypothetical protein
MRVDSLKWQEITRAESIRVELLRVKYVRA